MNKKFTVVTTAALALALTCTLPNVAQAAQTSHSAFGPAATQSVSPKADALDPDLAPTIQDLGADGWQRHNIRISGQAVPGSEFVVLANGAESRHAVGANGTAIASISEGLRPGTNVLQVRQVLGATTTPIAELTYKLGQDVPTDEFDAAKAPTVRGWEVYNAQGRALLAVFGQDVPNSRIEAEFAGETVSAPVYVNGGAVVELTGLDKGSNEVRFRQVSAGEATPWTEATALVLGSASVESVEPKGTTALVSASTDETGDYVIRDDKGDEVVRQSTKSRAQLTVPLPSTAKTYTLTVERDGFRSDPTNLQLPKAGESEVRPLTITSNGKYEVDTRATITGTATPGAEVYVEIPGAAYSEYADVDAKGNWSLRTKVLTADSYPGNRAYQYTAEGLQDSVPFDLERDAAVNPLRVDVQSRTEDTVTLGVTYAGRGHLEIKRGDTVVHESERTNGNATTPVTLAADAGATTFEAVFTPAEGGSALTNTVVAQPFDLTGEYVPATVEGGLSYRGGGDLTTIFGHGTPGGSVHLQVPGTGLDEHVAVNDEGYWEYGGLPLSGNAYDGNTVSQSNDAGSNSVAFSLVAQVALDGIADGDTIDKRPTFSGTGDEDATITVTDGKTRAVLGTTTVRGGTWSIDTTADLTAGAHDITVTQESARGASDPVKVRVEVEDAQAKPFEVETPGSGETVRSERVGSAQFPNGMVEFTGTGSAGAVIEVRRSNDKLAGTTTVGDDGRWTLQGDFAFVKYPTTTVTHTLNGTTDKHVITDLTILENVDEQPLVITSPTVSADNPTPKGDGGRFPNAKLTVTGSAHPGDTVTLYRPSGLPAGSGIADKDGAFAFDADVNWGTWTFTATTTRNGVTIANATLTDVTISHDGIRLPFEVLTPGSGEVITSAKNTGPGFPNARVRFTGTGTAGDEVTVVRDKNGKVGGRTTVGDDGRWALDADMPFEANQKVTVLQGGADGKVLDGLTVVEES